MYEIAYADFPWPYTSFGTAKLPYKAMTEKEILLFPWGKLLASRAAVFCWVTGPRWTWRLELLKRGAIKAYITKALLTSGLRPNKTEHLSRHQDLGHDL